MSLLQLFASPRCELARRRERGKAWELLLPTQAEWHGSCNSAWVSHPLRAVYLANQKAGSSTILALLERLAGAKPEPVWLPYVDTDRARLAQSNAMFYNCSSRGLSDRPPLDSYVAFTFVREPLATFYSGVAEVMSRTRLGNAARLFGADAPPPAFWQLPCNASHLYLRAFVQDVVARRSLGREAFHVWPQVRKLDVSGVRLNFVGDLALLEEHLALLLRDHLRLGEAALARLDLPAALREVAQRNPAADSRDRCHRPIPKAQAEREALRGVACALMEADDACFGEYYGRCASGAPV